MIEISTLLYEDQLELNFKKSAILGGGGWFGWGKLENIEKKITAYSTEEKFVKADFCVRIVSSMAAFIFTKSTVPLRNFLVEQTVTAGNGTLLIDVDLSSNVTITGFTLHLPQMFIMTMAHKTVDTLTVDSQQILHSEKSTD